MNLFTMNLYEQKNCFRSNCEIDKQHLCMTEQLEELLSQLT